MSNYNLLDENNEDDNNFYYLTENENNKSMSESIIPILRIRLKAGRKIGMEIGYSYDFNISKLGNINSIATNEININFYYSS